MEKFRLIKFEQDKKWYATGPGAYTDKRNQAPLFTEIDFIQWGEAAGLTKEPLGEDQRMALVGPDVAPMLPGLGGDV